MKVIEKKTWPKYFQLMIEGKKNVEIRLADFEIEEGGEILFREFDPLTQEYSGRSIMKVAGSIHHVFLTDFHDIEEIHEKGHLIIELKDKEISEWIE